MYEVLQSRQFKYIILREFFLDCVMILCCRRSGGIGEMNSRRRLADVCGSHKKCCDLQLGFSSSFCEQKDIQLNVWIGSPVTVEPSIVPFVLEKPTVF